MRTKVLASYLNNLSNLNAHWAFSLFSSEQFSIDNSYLFRINENEYTPSIYKNNKYRNICNWKLSDINKYLSNHLKFIFNSSYLYAYSVYEIYLNELIDFIIDIEKVLNNKIFDNLDSNNDFFSILEEIYNLQKTNIFNILLIKTHDYLRYRRNIIAHTEITDITISKGFKDISRDYGYSLNKFWHNEKCSLNIDINFQDVSHIHEMNENQIRDLYRLYRKLAYEIDKTIICRYTKDQLIEFYSKTYATFIRTNKQKNHKRFSNLIRNHFRIEFDDHLNDKELTNLIRLTF